MTRSSWKFRLAQASSFYEYLFQQQLSVSVETKPLAYASALLQFVPSNVFIIAHVTVVVYSMLATVMNVVAVSRPSCDSQGNDKAGWFGCSPFNVNM